jgi:hypothetical protein
MIWLLYMAAVQLISGVVGLHLGRFRAAYTEMTGMMAGMTMGMLNGFLLGFGAAAAASAFGLGPAMFWGNALGILLGLGLGAYFGRAGGLMGIMDGAMGGLMGGSMGAMLAVMLSFPDWALLGTAALLGVVYLAGMFGLVLLIEKSAPEHAALHRLAPWFTRAVATEVAEVTAAAEEGARGTAAGAVAASPHRGVRRPPAPTQAAPAARSLRVPPPSEQPLAWGGLMLAVLVGLGALVLLTNPTAGALANNGGNPANTLQGRTDTGVPLQPEFIQQLQAKAVTVPVQDGRQTLDLKVNGTTMSYTPGVIQVKRGLPVRLNLQITGADPGCGRVVSLQLLGAKATAAPGEVVPLDFTPSEAGVFQINCNMHMMEPGYLIVTN